MKLEEGWKVQIYTNLSNIDYRYRVQTILSRMADADGEEALLSTL